MNASKTVIISVLVYAVLFAILYFTFINSKFTGGDAAGNAMSKGYTYILGLGGSFIIAIILTGINFWLMRNGSPLWIKALALVPILLPMIVIGADYFAIGNREQGDDMERNLRLTVEIRSSEKIDSARLIYKSSMGGYSRKMVFIEGANNFYYDEQPFTVSYEVDGRFKIKSGNFETEEYYFDLEDAPDPLEYSGFIPLNLIGTNYSDSLKIEFRYMVDKAM